MKYLISTKEVYRVDTENLVENLVNEAKNDNRFVLTKYNVEKREQKMKGVVVDEWYRITLEKKFTDEKEPESEVRIDYEVM